MHAVCSVAADAAFCKPVGDNALRHNLFTTLKCPCHVSLIKMLLGTCTTCVTDTGGFEERSDDVHVGPILACGEGDGGRGVEALSLPSRAPGEAPVEYAGALGLELGGGVAVLFSLGDCE